MKKDKSCIFCKIVSGEEISSKVYEDDSILGFMDLRPINQGEILVIPKEHIDHFYDISDDLASSIMIIAQKLSRRIKQKLNPVRVGYVVHGFGVPHAHLVVVPLHHRDDITSARFMRINNGNIIIDFDQIPRQPRVELDRIAEVLRED